jgi:proteasome assembly chaperone (PAC2) family protein
VTDLELVDDLVDPILIAAFEGWNDAADAASSTLDRLIAEWDAEVVAELDPEDYYDFQLTRPHISVDEAGTRMLSWPTTRVLVARPPGASRDIVLLRGVEPNLRWRQFCEEILEVAETLGVRLVVALGALLADTPHTRPVPVSGTVSDPELGVRLGLEQSRYEGPTGITGVFQDACAAADMPSLSLWAAVPHYVAQPPCPKATLALLGRLEDLLDIAVPVEDLVEDARAWERGVDEMASDDAEVADYVKQLEEQRDTSELPEASGDAIAREFERYLKRRQREGEI